jgi:uncharacterized membrane protein
MADDGRGFDADDEPPLEQIAAGAVTGMTLLVAFGLLAAEVSFFWVAFPVGFGGALPVAIGLARRYQRQQETNRTETEDALETLRRRYARGELTDAEFEERVERLLETESVPDAQSFTDRRRSEDADDARNPEYERE